MNFFKKSIYKWILWKNSTRPSSENSKYSLPRQPLNVKTSSRTILTKLRTSHISTPRWMRWKWISIRLNKKRKKWLRRLILSIQIKQWNRLVCCHRRRWMRNRFWLIMKLNRKLIWFFRIRLFRIINFWLSRLKGRSCSIWVRVLLNNEILLSKNKRILIRF